MKTAAFSIYKTIFLLFLCFFVFLFSPFFVEASTQTIHVDHSQKEIYANGLPITLEAGSETKTKIRYSNGIEEVYYLFDGTDEADLREYTIYGGSQNQPVDSCQVTLNGGSVLNLFGGGKNLPAEAKTTFVKVMGGEVRDSLYGGGRASRVLKSSTVRILDGKIPNVYGGGYQQTAFVPTSFVYITGGQIGQRVRANNLFGNTVSRKGFGIITFPVPLVNGFDHLLYRSEENFWNIQGHPVIPKDMEITISEGQRLHIPANTSLTNQGILRCDSTIDGEGQLLGDGQFLQSLKDELIKDIPDQVYTGEPICPMPVTNASVFLGQQFLTDTKGYTLSYHNNTQVGTATLRWTEGERSFERPFQILSSSALLNKELEITNNGIASNTFTYGDHIDIKVKPVASGIRRSNSPLQNHQMALFLHRENGTLLPIGEPVTASADGYFYFHHDTSDKLLALGPNTLSLRYAGNENIDAATHEVTVTLKAQPIQKTQDLSFTLNRNASFTLPTFQSPSGETLSGTTNYFRGDTPCTYEDILALWKNSSQRVETFRYTFTSNGYYTGTISGQVTLNLPDDRPSYSGIYRISIDERHRQIDDADTAGYFAAMPHKVIVKNTGNRSTGMLNIRLSKGSDSAFELSRNHLDSIARGKNASFSIMPKIGLPEGIYEERFFLSGSRSLSASGTIRFVVQADENTSKKTYQDWTHDHHAVPLDKTWTIRLNRPLDKNSVHHAHLFLTAASCPQEKIPAQPVLSDDRKEIRLIPDEPLVPSASYSLWIRGLRSEDGLLLRTPIRMDFKTASE